MKLTSKFIVVALLVSITGGCLLNAPTELEAEERVTPQILTHTATPTNLQFYFTDISSPQTIFSVQYTSEDLGEPVSAFLYLDWGSGPVEQVGFAEATPQSLSDEPNEMGVEWPLDIRADLPAGCYTLTMAITHSDNIQTGLVNVPIEFSKTDFITWWIIHGFTPQEVTSVTLDACPQPGDSDSFTP